MVATVTVPPVGPDGLEALLRCLLPTTPVPTPPPKPIPTELESLLQRLLSGVPVPTPTQDRHHGIEDLAAAPNSGVAGSGLAGATGPRSQILGYDCVFLMWKITV